MKVNYSTTIMNVPWINLLFSLVLFKESRWVYKYWLPMLCTQEIHDQTTLVWLRLLIKENHYSFGKFYLLKIDVLKPQKKTHRPKTLPTLYINFHLFRLHDLEHIHSNLIVRIYINKYSASITPFSLKIIVDIQHIPRIDIGFSRLRL